MGNKEVKIDPAEEAKKQGKVISRAIRQIERELKKNEADEKKTLKLIKDMATKNQHVSTSLFSF
jgi:restriction endonuclease S subunit